MRIVFGGAFNPVTIGHMKIVEFLKEKYPKCKFTFLPVSSAYTKRSLASNFHRLNMLNLAIEGLEDVNVSPLELNDSDFLGTYQSLIRLSDMYDEEIYFVMGADNLQTIDKWINASGLLSEFKFIVLARNTIDIEKQLKAHPLLKKFSENFVIYKNFDMNVSSTEFRKTFNKDFVPKEVYDYIIDNNLYGGDLDAL